MERLGGIAAGLRPESAGGLKPVLAAHVVPLFLGGCMASAPLHIAIGRRNPQVALRLITTSKDVIRADGQGRTGLYAEARSCQVRKASAPLGRGALTSHRDKAGAKSLIDACVGRHRATANLLGAVSSDIPEADGRGNTCLIRAARQGHLPVVKLALASGADIQHANNQGSTTLTMAATGGHDGTARHLVRSGGRIGTANEFGITAYDVAVERDNRGLAKSLLQAGAVPSVFSDSVPRLSWYTAQSHFLPPTIMKTRTGRGRLAIFGWPSNIIRAPSTNGAATRANRSARLLERCFHPC